MKKYIFFLLIFLLGTSYFFNKFGFAQEKLKFSTQQTRELWQVCSVAFRNQNPGIGQNIYMPVCDCYVDHIRNNYTPDQVTNTMTKEEYTKLSQDLRKVCNPNINPTEKFTKWEYHQPTLVAKSYLALAVEKTNLIKKLLLHYKDLETP